MTRLWQVPALVDKAQSSVDAHQEYRITAIDLLRYIATLDVALQRNGEQIQIEMVHNRHFDDLLFAMACLQHNEFAIRRLTGDLIPKACAALDRRGLVFEDDLRAQLIHDLLFAENPLLQSFYGKGRLLGWLKVIVKRRAQKLVAQAPTPSVDETQLLNAIAGTQNDPHQYMVTEMKGLFREALHYAISHLPAADRLLLRQYFVDQLTIDKLAALYGQHRTTYARRISGIIEDIRVAIRNSITSNANVTSAEYESYERLIAGSFEISSIAALRATPRPRR